MARANVVPATTNMRETIDAVNADHIQIGCADQTNWNQPNEIG